MKNKIKEIFDNISDADLILSILEIKESEETGFIGPMVRDYAVRVKEITGEGSSMDLYHTTINLLKQAAYRWIK